MLAHGPFPCGSHSDHVCFGSDFENLLEKSQEKAVADKGYKDSSCIISETCSNESENRSIGRNL